MADYERLDYGSPDGALLGGASTDKIGFYGKTPVVQAVSVTSVTTTGASSTTNAYGFTTAAQGDAVVASLNAVIVALTNLGFISAT
jgi:hypothetical protein